ncbi:chemotaxis protein CheB [Methylocaldum szegediense]
MIVIGASAGCVEALKRLVGDWHAELEATFLVVLHVPSHNTNFLPQILR